MKVVQLDIPGVLLVEPRVFGDQRGWFVESYHRDRYRQNGIAIDMEFVQDNHSSSVRGTLRGLHYQARHPQGKLVWVTRGAIFDVVVDLREGAPTFGSWTGAELDADNRHQIWIPPGFAHGFLVLSDQAEVQYKTTTFYTPSDEHSIRYDDPDLAIRWPLDGLPIQSERDRAAGAFRDAEPIRA